jgi:hypothetical protein
MMRRIAFLGYVFVMTLSGGGLFTLKPQGASYIKNFKSGNGNLLDFK